MPLEIVTQLTLYSSPTSPFVRRVKFALHRLNLSYECKEVGNLFPPPQWYEKINPLGLIPSLQADGSEPIIDSTEILDFLNQRFGSVWNEEPQERLIERRFSALANATLLRAVEWRLESVRPDARQETLQAAAKSIQVALETIEERLKTKSVEAIFEWVQPYADLYIMLDYLDFRLGFLTEYWQSHFEQLTALFKFFQNEKFFLDTDPRRAL